MQNKLRHYGLEYFGRYGELLKREVITIELDRVLNHAQSTLFSLDGKRALVYAVPNACLQWEVTR